MKALGVDIGGSGIKGAVVDLQTGKYLTNRVRYPTPQPAAPKAIGITLKKLVNDFSWDGDIGCGFPAVVRQGIIHTASNIDLSWIDINAEQLFSKLIGYHTRVINDADAAGMAEMSFGVGKDEKGTVILITVGTGLGTSIFRNGILIPNTELGHVRLKNKIAENYTSDAVRKNKDLSWKKWGKRFNRFLKEIEKLVRPDLMIIGGGSSKKFHRYSDRLDVNCKVIPAQLKNEAGIIGAALSTRLNRIH